MAGRESRRERGDARAVLSVGGAQAGGRFRERTAGACGQLGASLWGLHILLRP